MRTIITGANRGIGSAIAKKLSSHGHEVIALNRTVTQDPAIPEIACELRDDKSVLESIHRAAEILGGVDVCILNAAVRRLALVEQMDLSDWRESIDVNLTSCFLIMREVMPYLRNSSGLLVVIGSQARDHSFETGAAYCASKAALKALCEVALMENRGDGVRICHMSLGAVKNRPLPNDSWKIVPDDIGSLIITLAEGGMTSFVSEIEVRPQCVPEHPLTGKERIQPI